MIPWRRKNPLHQGSERFHRLRLLGGDVVAVDTLGETPDRFRETPTVFTRRMGQSPATMEVDDRASVEAPGIVRRDWRQLAAFIPGPPSVKVSTSPRMPQRQMRYMTRSLYAPAGSDNSRLSGFHTVIIQKTRQQPATKSAGIRRGPPMVRNRITSFGSRVQPLNRRLASADTG